MAQRIILSFILAFIISGCSKYYQFDELYDKGDFIKAYSVLEKISNKTNAHYNRRLYRIIIKMAVDGDPDFIEKLRDIAGKEHPAEVENYAQFTDAYLDFLDAKSPQSYTAVLSKLTAIKTLPVEFHVYAYKIRGISLYKLGKYNEAIIDLNQSFKLSPYIDNLYFIGMCYYNLDDQKQAIHYFNRVISGTLNNFFKSLAYFQLGEISYYGKKYQDALEHYVSAANHYSGSADYTFKISKCLKQLKYNRLSPKFSKISLRIQKDYANAWFFLNIN